MTGLSLINMSDITEIQQDIRALQRAITELRIRIEKLEKEVLGVKGK